MQNFYETQQKRTFNPVVEAMFSNYQNLYQNYDPNVNYNKTFDAKNEQGNLDNKNNNQIGENNLENVNNNANNFVNNTNQNNFNMNNIANMLGQMGGNNNYMDIIKAISGNNFSGDKQNLILNMLSNMNNNKANAQNKKTTINSSDFSNLTSIEDYNFID